MTMMIPEIDIAYCRGFEGFSTPVRKLKDAIQRLQNGESSSETVNFTYSIARPQGRVLMNTVSRGEFWQDIQEMPLATPWIKYYFKEAFKRHKEILEHDVKGLTINLRALSNSGGYEHQTRDIDHRRTEIVGGDKGDFTLVCAEVFGNLNGYANTEYQTTLGETTNSGLMTIININNHQRKWTLESDPRLYGYPKEENGKIPWGASVYRFFIHEIGHMFGVGHRPYPRQNKDYAVLDTDAPIVAAAKLVNQIAHLEQRIASISRIKPTVMNALTLPAQKFTNKWINNTLMNDPLLRYNFSVGYGYSLDDVTLSYVPDGIMSLGVRGQEPVEIIQEYDRHIPFSDYVQNAA